MARGGFETSEALVKMAVDADVTEFPVLEAGFMIAEMVMGKGYIVVVAGPPDLSVSEGDFFFLG